MVHLLHINHVCYDHVSILQIQCSDGELNLMYPTSGVQDREGDVGGGGGGGGGGEGERRRRRKPVLKELSSYNDMEEGEAVYKDREL